MLEKLLSELIMEIKKIRIDLDAIKSCQKTIAESKTPVETGKK